MFNNIGTFEIIIIAVVIMVLFGTNKLPEFTRSIGEASKEYKRGVKGEDEEPPLKKTKKKTKSKGKSKTKKA